MLTSTFNSTIASSAREMKATVIRNLHALGAVMVCRQAFLQLSLGGMVRGTSRVHQASRRPHCQLIEQYDAALPFVSRVLVRLDGVLGHGMLLFGEKIA